MAIWFYFNVNKLNMVFFKNSYRNLNTFGKIKVKIGESDSSIVFHIEIASSLTDKLLLAPEGDCINSLLEKFKNSLQSGKRHYALNKNLS